MGCRTESKVRLGAWSWDVATGEEFRVGAGLAEPYHITWCAVEYFESTGAILRMLLQYSSPNLPHLGRTILHHAILCGNARAFEVLLSCGADIEFPIQTSQNADLLRPIHLAARLGSAPILRLLINAGCDLNSRTGYGETALMICARHKHEECFKLLASAGSDFGLSDVSNHSAASIAGLSKWNLGFQNAVLEVIRAGNIARSSNPEVFSSLLFVTRANDVEALTRLIKHQDLQNIDERDDFGFSAVMVAAAGGHVEIFRLLVNAGADLEVQNKYGETAITLAKGSQKRDAFAEILSMKGDIKYSLHNAARFGNQDMVQELVSKGFDVNLIDCDGYTPLMYAARSNDGGMCKLLISLGARCGIKNSRHETAVSLAKGDEAESAILDEVAREMVIGGCRVKKHTKMGKGAPHLKMLRMVEGGGVLSWGKSSRRNVICRGAEVGPSSTFRWNRRRKSGGGEDGGLFRVVTTKNQEFHFSCCGGVEMAELWVRGIRLVTREAIFGMN